VILRTDDPLAGRPALRVADLADRRWFQLPDGTDPVWRAYWNGNTPTGGRRDGPVVHTVQECLQAVLWNDTIGLATLDHALPDGLTSTPLTDMPPSRLVVAWNTTNHDPLVASFTHLAALPARNPHRTTRS